MSPQSAWQIREAYRIMIVRCTLSAYRHFVFCIGLVLACGIFIDVTERIVVFIFPLFGNSKNFCYWFDRLTAYHLKPLEYFCLVDKIFPCTICRLEYIGLQCTFRESIYSLGHLSSTPPDPTLPIDRNNIVLGISHIPVQVFHHTETKLFPLWISRMSGQ